MGTNLPTLIGVTVAMTALSAAPAAAGQTASDAAGQTAGAGIQAMAGGYAPVAVITREDIEMSGLVNLADLIGDRTGLNTFGLGRPLIRGEDHAAILINGRDYSESGWSFATLPVSAVERIEILDGNVAGRFGGHAVAGAVNIILRRDYNGVAISGNATRPVAEGGDLEQASALWGGAVGDGHLTIGIDGVRRQEIRDADRPYTRARIPANRMQSDAVGVSAGGNTVVFGVPGANPPIRFSILGTCPEGPYTGPLTRVGGQVCGHAYADTKWFDSLGTVEYHRSRRGALFLNADFPLDDDLDLHIDARVAQRETLFRYAPSVGTFPVETASISGLAGQLATDHSIAATAVPDEVLVAHRFLGHGGREWQADINEYDLVVGLGAGFDNGIGHETNLHLYRYDSTTTGNTFVSQPLITDEIASGRYNIVDPLSTETGHLAAIRDTTVALNRELVIDYQEIALAFDGDAFTAPGGNALWVAGVELARQDYRNDNDHRDRDGNFVPTREVLGSGGSSAFGDRQRWSAHGELTIPVLENWDITLSGRQDFYDDVDNVPSGQIASRYQLNDHLGIRGAWGAGGRVPGLSEMHLHNAVSYPFVHEPEDRSVRVQIEQRLFGNSDLKPDKTSSLSAGASLAYGPVSASADWFMIDTSDAPAVFPAQTILDNEDRTLADGPVRRHDDGSLHYITTRYANIADRKVAGVDLQANATWTTGWADVELNARWLRQTRNKTSINNQPIPADWPRDRIHASVGVSRGALSARWNVHTLSGYRDPLGGYDFPRWTGHDLSVRWQNVLGLDGLDIIGGVLNIGDEQPTVDRPQVMLDQALGRTLFLTMHFAFGK